MDRGATAIAVWILAAATAHAAPSPVLRATPDVGVVHLPGPGSVTLSNDSADPITISSITRDPGCDDEVTAELTTPATVLPGNNVSVAVKCASTFTTGMKRCGFHALPTAGDPLVDFEGVCEAGNAITLAAAPTMFDFGDVAIGASASKVFTITNNSAMTIARLALQTTDLGATFELGAPCNPDARECDASIVGIGATETTQLTVWCRPKAAGVHTAQLYIATDTPAHLAMPIVLTCTGTTAPGPAFALTGDPVNAGGVEVTSGSATPRALHVRNAGTQSLSITSVQIVDSGDGAANDWSFTFDPGTSMCASLAPSCTLAAGKEVGLALRFDPTAIGARSAVLVISYTDGAARSRTIPLTGAGLGATLSFLGAPLAIELGTIPVGTPSAPQTFSLYNHGDRDATVDLAFDSPGPFALSPPTMLALPPGPAAGVMVTCTPTAAGEATAQIQVTSTDATLAAPIDINAHCTGTTAALFTQPSAIQLGEVRLTDAPFTVPVTLRSTGAPLQIVAITLENPSQNLELEANPPLTTVAMFSLHVNPAEEGSLDDDIIVTTSTNITVRVPVRGTIVAGADNAYVVPPTRPLGTFCVNQPTTPDRFALTATTGTVLLSKPGLANGKQSPFDLTLLSPTSYPTPIAPNTAATVVITPKRSNVVGMVSDDLLWTTDVAGLQTTHTMITASFVDDGGAVAPSRLAFAPTVIHLDTDNAQRVTLQNCDTQAIDLQITVPAPFRVDVGALPTSLAPNETATFSVGFHPTRVGMYMADLVITSPQFPIDSDLRVMLEGEGFTTPLPSDSGVTPPEIDDTSFYSCDGCASNKPNTCALALGVLVVIARRRRRR